MRDALRWILMRLIDLVAKVEIRGMENLPKHGAFVITTNHLGMLDVTLLYYSIHRWDVFVPVAEKWERIGFLKWLGRHLNWVFVDRFNPDLKAMRTMMSLMEKGHTLVIAPEGTRSRVGSMIEGKPGKLPAAAGANRAHRAVGN
jgi:1-acyl-sn-glycerol-3-phosphate acyltransferase